MFRNYRDDLTYLCTPPPVASVHVKIYADSATFILEVPLGREYQDAYELWVAE